MPKQNKSISRREHGQALIDVLLPVSNLDVPMPQVKPPVPMTNTEAIADIELAVLGLKQQIRILDVLESKGKLSPEYRQRLIRIKDDLYNYSRTLGLSD